MKKGFIGFCLALVTTFISAQGLEINVELAEGANEKINLAHYFNSQIYLDDTIHVDENGKGAFRADSLLPQGLYKIYLNSDNHFDFLLGEDQKFTIINPDFNSQNTEITGAVESEEFINYMEFLSDLQQKRDELVKEKETATEERNKEIDEEISTLTPQLHNYWKQKAEEYPGSMLAAFLMANYVPTPLEEDIPEDIKSNDSTLLRYRFDYQERHYFDYFDLLDERLMYTPLSKPKIENYFSQIVLQTVDSIRAATIDLIKYVRPNKKMFQYVTSYMLNQSVNSNIMGMDALFVDLAEKYYLTGEAFWADSTTIENVKENLLFTEQNLIGNIAPELQLESIDGEQYYSLHQVDAKYTLVLLYEPNCSHCMEFVPELHERIYPKYRDKGFEVYAIYTMDNKNEWVEFVEEHDLYDWINVWDEYHISRFKIKYDARKTPGVYLLDENKKIVAKKLSVEQIDEYLGERL